MYTFCGVAAVYRWPRLQCYIQCSCVYRIGCMYVLIVSVTQPWNLWYLSVICASIALLFSNPNHPRALRAFKGYPGRAFLENSLRTFDLRDLHPMGLLSTVTLCLTVANSRDERLGCGDRIKLYPGFRRVEISTGSGSDQLPSPEVTTAPSTNRSSHGSQASESTTALLCHPRITDFRCQNVG